MVFFCGHAVSDRDLSAGRASGGTHRPGGGDPGRCGADAFSGTA